MLFAIFILLPLVAINRGQVANSEQQNHSLSSI